jgi:hypothetical protein
MEVVIGVDPHKATNGRRGDRRARRIGRAGDLPGRPERTASPGAVGQTLPGAAAGRWRARVA